MANRRTRKKPNSSVGNRGAAVGSDVSGSAIITGNQNVVQLSPVASSVATALHQLRAPVGDFVGREQEIKSVIDSLRRNSRVCITGINGMGGIGKTELALFVANRLLPDYPDAQFFINLLGTEDKPLPPHEVMASCIRAFIGPEASLPDDLNQLSQLYRSQLSGKRVLLLLDNAADDKQVLPLQPPTGCALLVTSRQAIVLPKMTSLTLKPLTESEARELLLEIAPRADSAAEEICSLCGYLPLAIRAAGSLLAVTLDLDPVAYAAQLKDERNRLKRIGTKGVELGVAASFNLSYARLEPEAARVFRFLSVFPASFDAVAAETVCDDPDHVQLSDLVTRSLVLYEVGTNRYRLHDLARLFADAELSAEERAEDLERHARYYATVLADADALYLHGGETLAEGLALFDLEWDNIQAGHAWIQVQGVDADVEIARLAMEYPICGVNILLLRQHARERIRWLELGLAAARRFNDQAYEGATLGNLGHAYADLGETKRAIHFYEQVLLIYRNIGDRKGEGLALNDLGRAYAELGDTKGAIEFNERALLIFRELGNRRNESLALNNLGRVHADLGENQESIQFYEQSLNLARDVGDRQGESFALGNLGIAYYEIGKTQRSIQFHERALNIAREIGDRRTEGAALWNLSRALERAGKHDQAIQYVKQSLVILEQIEDPFATKLRAQLAAWRDETD